MLRQTLTLTRTPPLIPAGQRHHAQRTLHVGGLTRCTSLDYPGKLSAVVFVQGCPWRCGYCHNEHLQRRGAEGEITWPQVLDWLTRRAGLLDAVVFSGGEPTMDAQLETAIGQTRALGFSIGLHSAGMYPERMRCLLPHIDWLGLDVKAPLDDASMHEQIVGVRDGHLAVERALEYVQQAGMAFEVRTTAHPEWLPEAALLQLAEDLARRGVRHYVLQLGRTKKNRFTCQALDYPSSTALARLSALFPSFQIRGDAT